MLQLLRLALVVLFCMGKLPHLGTVLMEGIGIPVPPLPTLDSNSAPLTVFNFVFLAGYYVTGSGLYVCAEIITEVVFYQLFSAKPDEASSAHKGKP